MTRADLPPTGRALLDALVSEGGTLDYRDPRMTTPGLTALRHRGLARVFRDEAHPLSRAIVVLTVDGRALASGGES